MARQTRILGLPPGALKIGEGKEEFLECGWRASSLGHRALSSAVCFPEARLAMADSSLTAFGLPAEPRLSAERWLIKL